MSHTGRMAASARNAARDQWSANPAGVNYAAADEGSAEFYQQMSQTRYELQPWHPGLLRAWAPTGRLLEIGCGAGTDHSMLASMADSTVGIDLALRGASLTGRRLKMEGRSGGALVADGEQLPFPDASFDAVYSFGVIHHTDHPEQIVSEIARVLRPKGRFLVALYHRHSLFAADMRQTWWRNFRQQESWSDYLSRLEFGGEETRPVVRLYSRQSAQLLFHRPEFDHLRITTEHPRLRGRFIPGGRRFGWYVLVSGIRL